jgi:hypothetical protein
MTGFRSKDFRYNCDRDGCYHLGLPDWSDINETFPGAIRPTDIDGMVEINGDVLFIEQKSLGGCIPKGQVRAFTELSKKDGITVVAIRPGTEYEIQALFYVGGSGSGWQNMYRSDFLSWCRLWSDNAISKGRNAA